MKHKNKHEVAKDLFLVFYSINGIKKINKIIKLINKKEEWP